MLARDGLDTSWSSMVSKVCSSVPRCSEVDYLGEHGPELTPSADKARDLTSGASSSTSQTSQQELELLLMIGQDE